MVGNSQNQSAAMTFSQWLVSLADWSLWAPSLTTSALLGIAGFLIGTRYKASVEKSIQARFDEKLEKLRSQLRTDEEQAKADLKRQDAEIEALRSGALAGLAARRTALDKRRLEAVEKVWNSLISHHPHRLNLGFTKVLKMDYILKKCENDDDFRQLPDQILKMSGFGDPKNFPKIDSADTERPFVSPLLWALFSAYRSIVSFPTAQLVTAKAGLSADSLKADEVLKLAKIALPEHEAFIEKLQAASIPHLLNPLEQKILSEIQNSFEMPDSGTQSIAQAGEILKAASAVVEAQQRAQAQLPVAATQAAQEP